MLDGKAPTQSMTDKAEELQAYVRRNSDYIWGLIFGHYRYAELNDWLPFWGVRPDVSLDEIPTLVTSMCLVVDADLTASVFVDPAWDPEHKLDFRFDGVIIAINDEEFDIADGKLSFRAT